MDCKRQVRNGYGDYKFDNLDILPENSIKIENFKKNSFTDFYFNPENEKFYIKSKNKNGEKFVERRVDKDGRIHLKNNDNKFVHIKRDTLIKFLKKD